MKFLIVLISLFFSTAQATDVEKEQRWAEQIVDFLLDGEAIWLDDKGHEFLGIYTEAESGSDKAMIVVHGTGVHPDWEQVVKPVRVEMTSHGWNTLSIQMPILVNEAVYEDYVVVYPEVPGRFDTSIAHLQDMGMTEIVIVGHSQGATMASYYLSRNAHPIKAFVAVGMQATQKDMELNTAESLKNIDIPVLDLYGSADLEGVLQTAEDRKQAAANNKNYKQMVTDGAEHFYDGYEDTLIDTINGWLMNL